MATNIEEYNADELNAPAWMNEQFFKDVICHYLKETNVTVENFEISPASAKGDHYGSVMFRAKVDYSTKQGKFSKSIIIKIMPEVNTEKSEILGASKVFQTEIAMYTELLPKFEDILRAAGDDTTLCAKCIYHSLTPLEVMVFEDLVPQGYEVIRKRPANLEEIKSALEKLAKWHAVSYKLLKEKSEMFNELKYDITTVPNILEQGFMKGLFPNFLDSLKSSDSLKKYIKYFEPMKDIIIKRWAAIIREYRENPSEDAFYVLCHGDFHLRNMMFKGNDCMLIDFQMSYVGSMTNDVVNAIYMVLGPEERRSNYDELIYHYFTIFSKTLTLIGYVGKMPTLVDYRRQLFAKRYLELFSMSCFLPSFNHMRKGRDPAEFITDANKQRELFFDKEFQEELEFLLPRFLHLGYFEQLE